MKSYLSPVSYTHLITKRRLKCRTAAAGGICAVVVLGLSAWGAYNARIIQVTPYEITVNKDGGRLENLNVVLAADLHLGYNIEMCIRDRF